MSNEKTSLQNTLQVPAMWIPGFRNNLAQQDGTHRNILIKSWGGLGDEICAEATIRFALKTFKCDISLATTRPELFTHIKGLKRVFDLKEEQPIWQNYLCFDTIVPPEESLTWQFFSHALTQCVDFTSMCAFRVQMPTVDREVHLDPPTPAEEKQIKGGGQIWVHPGKHWISKTFPKDWWDAVLAQIKSNGFMPVIIGANMDDNRGTVDVNAEGCLDLRNKLTTQETIWNLMRARVLLTNDSAPLHMAVSGDAWIGFIATCKHPDYISHWRKGQWSWRMQNHGLGGLWDNYDICPNKRESLMAETCTEEQLRKWLPDPKEFANWGCAMYTQGEDHES